MAVPYKVVANVPDTGSPTGTVTVSDGSQSCTGPITPIGARPILRAYESMPMGSSSVKSKWTMAVALCRPKAKAK